MLTFTNGQGRPEQVRKNAFADIWSQATTMSKKRAFYAFSEILNFENRTIFKGDMGNNVSEGDIQKYRSLSFMGFAYLCLLSCGHA